MRSFVSLYLRAFTQPRRALEAALADPKRLRYGACAVAITAVVYALVYLFLSWNGGRPTVFMPWLAIPAEVYYRYNRYLVVPSILLAWIAASGFTQLARSAEKARSRTRSRCSASGCRSLPGGPGSMTS